MGIGASQIGDPSDQRGHRNFRKWEIATNHRNRKGRLAWIPAAAVFDGRCALLLLESHADMCFSFLLKFLLSLLQYC